VLSGHTAWFACSMICTWHHSVVRPSVCPSVSNAVHCRAQVGVEGSKCNRRVPNRPQWLLPINFIGHFAVGCIASFRHKTLRKTNRRNCFTVWNTAKLVKNAQRYRRTDRRRDDIMMPSAHHTACRSCSI